MNLPVQAGDNDVLRRMRRTYTRDYWFDRIQLTRERMPEATVATDIIVGFPGETETQFLQTLDLLEQTRCDKVHLAMYSPRPGTLSARWEDDVPSLKNSGGIVSSRSCRSVFRPRSMPRDSANV